MGLVIELNLCQISGLVGSPIIDQCHSLNVLFLHFLCCQQCQQKPTDNGQDHFSKSGAQVVSKYIGLLLKSSGLFSWQRH